MPIEVSNRWSRLSSLDSDELHIRLKQAISKRIDLAAYRLGLQRTGKDFVRAELKDSGVFLFSSTEAAHRAELICKLLPGEAERIVHEAEQILLHRFHLLGYESVQYGPEIDWYLDAVHGKRAPRKPGFKIRFLDFQAVGDHKIVWELNRHQHLVTLAKAWHFRRDWRFVEEIVRQWYGWQEANPYPIGMNWASSLEVAFRSLSWIWVWNLLSDCAVLPRNFGSDCTNALALNAWMINRYLSTYFSPNTHLLGEALALFFIGTALPQLTRAEHWKEKGWTILLREAQRQVLPDGLYFEQSLYYHVYALDFFLYARLLAERNRLPVPPEFDAVLGKMLQLLETLSRAGPPMGFGDDDGGRLFNPHRNRSEHLLDPLSYGALVLGRDGPPPGVPVTEEAIWLFGEDAISRISGTSRESLEIDSTVFENSGIYLLAGKREGACQMLIDGGPQGVGKSGHGHADALAVQVWLEGVRLLSDPGTCSYSSPERDLYRGTSAHNTVRVDGVDQAIPSGPFAWTSIPKVQVQCWIPGKTFALFSGSHDGYERLPDPVRHCRFVFHLHDEFWLVRDVVDGKDVHQIEIFWHFEPSVNVIDEGKGFRAEIGDGQKLRVGLLPVEGPAWSAKIEPGYSSPAYGSQVSASSVRCALREKLPTEHAMLLVPERALNSSPKFIRVSGLNNGLSVYRYEQAGTIHVMIFAPSNLGSWEFEQIQSDARFFYYCMRAEQLKHLILCEGQSANVNGKPFVTRERRLQRFEWLNLKNVPQIYSAEEPDQPN